MIEIKEVGLNKKLAKDFVDFPIKLYKDCPYYVPGIYSSEIEAITTNKYYKEQCDHIAFLAYKDGVLAGRIEGIVQKAANEKWKRNRVRFTRFDVIDDQEVANALFDAVANWGKSKGLNEIVGPLGYSDLEREGLLVYGFEELSTFEEAYNYPYYQKLVENYGFVKEVGWEERQLLLKEEYFETMHKAAERTMEKNNLHYAEFKSVNELVKKYRRAFFEILDDTYVDIYGTAPFTEKMQIGLFNNMKALVDIECVIIVLDENERPVAFGISFPSISRSVQACKGKLFPFGFIKILKEKHHPYNDDFGLIGVRKEYRNSGLASVIIDFAMRTLKRKGVKYTETNLNLETNTAILGLWKYFDARLHKKRNAYLKKID